MQQVRERYGTKLVVALLSTVFTYGCGGQDPELNVAQEALMQFPPSDELPEEPSAPSSTAPSTPAPAPSWFAEGSKAWLSTSAPTAGVKQIYVGGRTARYLLTKPNGWQGLYLSAEDLWRDSLFAAEPRDTRYVGCGIKAAQNALRYFAVDLSQAKIAETIKTVTFGALTSDIATFPGDLQKGLQALLNKHSTRKFSVDRHISASTSAIRFWLRAGYPVIALVNNGSHWVVVAGHDPVSGQYFIHDNDNSYWSRISLNFSGATGLWADIGSRLSPVYDDPTYLEGTLITFRQLESCRQHLDCGNLQTCSFGMCVGQAGYCRSNAECSYLGDALCVGGDCVQY